MLNGVGIDKKVGLGQLLQMAVVVVVGGITIYIAVVANQAALGHRLDTLEYVVKYTQGSNVNRFEAIEKAFDKWQTDEKERLVGIGETLRQLNVAINTVNLTLARIEASANGRAPKPTR